MVESNEEEQKREVDSFDQLYEKAKADGVTAVPKVPLEAGEAPRNYTAELDE